jgi:uncharacterized protein YidB (DUF937 family)
MGLFDSILKGLGVGGNALPAEHHNALLDTVVGMLSDPQSGGLQGLLDTFKQKGLGEIVGSWVSTGKNLPVSPDQLQQVMGSGKIQEIAQSLGIDASKVSAGLSKILPQVVDKLTPQGSVPGQDALSEGLASIKKLLGV